MWKNDIPHVEYKEGKPRQTYDKIFVENGKVIHKIEAWIPFYKRSLNYQIVIKNGKPYHAKEAYTSLKLAKQECFK